MRRLLMVLVSMMVVLAGCTVNPVTGEKQLDLLGEAQEIEMGKSFYPQAIQGSLGPIADDELQRRVSEVGQSLVEVSHRPALPWEFVAVNEPEVNAFALPGGKICITRGLLSRFESEDGMAAVLGHEVGHVTARHAVAAYNRQLLATALVVGSAIYMEAKDVEHRQLYTFGAVVGAQLVLAHYSREQERQCDELGLEYAVSAGFSPHGMVETHAVLLSLHDREPGAIERMFASHPMSRERLATAERRVAALPEDVRSRPLRKQEYRRYAGEVIERRPAWDLAREAQHLLAKDKDLDAEARLAEAVRLVPDEGVVHTLHAVALGELDRKGPAADQARQGARLAPKVFVSRAVAGEILLKPAPAEALENLDAAEELLPGVPAIALMRGRALEALKRRSEAVDAYREAYKRDPEGKVGASASERLRALGVA
jgi:predicted Zn-dependent protease